MKAVSRPRHASRRSGSFAPTILVVEDEIEIRELIEHLLRLEGFQTIPAGDGIEALRVARMRRPNAITLDLWLPLRDGRATLADLAADPVTHRIPVIVVSAQPGPIALTPQVTRVVSKPFEVDELIRAVNEALIPVRV